MSGRNLNRKNALDLWRKNYGNQQKVKDFSGREMAMGSYSDKNSKFCWNIDHVVPISHNGSNEESNLICCHIKTNEEKGNSYPGFNANGKSFNVVKKGDTILIIDRNNNNTKKEAKKEATSSSEDQVKKLLKIIIYLDLQKVL